MLRVSEPVSTKNPRLRWPFWALLFSECRLLRHLFRRMGRQNLDIFPWSESDNDDDDDDDCVLSPASSGNGIADLDMSDPLGCLEMNEGQLAALSMKLLPEWTTASKILWHCVKSINAIREQCGGPNLCIFKIGLTSNPIQRREGYRQQNFKCFAVIHRVNTTHLLGMLEMLEAALIAEFHDEQRCCRNRQLGGESMRDRFHNPRFPPPYFAYVAATCAAQKEPVLG